MKKELYLSNIKIIEEEYDIFISEDAISTINYILKSNSKVLYFFKNIIKRWNVVPFGIEIIEESIEFCINTSSDLEDTLQCICTKKNDCKIFITSDKKFIDRGIEVVSYDHFLNIVK